MVRRTSARALSGMEVHRKSPATTRRSRRARRDQRDRLRSALCGLLLLDLLVVVRVRATGDLDAPWLHRLRDLARELDLQQSVLEARAFHLHVIGKAEGAAEVPRRDALIQHLLIVLLGLVPLHGERVLLGRDRDVLGRETRERERDCAMWLPGPRAVFLVWVGCLL